MKSRMPRSATYAARLAGGYALGAGLYIVLSGRLAARFSSSLEQLERVEEIKGVLFVLFTATALFFASRSAFRLLETSAEALVKKERALLANERRVYAGLISSTVAHDANNVLMGVMSDLALLKEEPQNAAETNERLAKSIDRLISLNRRLVQVGRQNSTSQQAPLELNHAVADAIELSRLHPSLRSVDLQVAAAAPVTITAQPLLISQIVTNLVINAAEAAPKGVVEVRVLERPQEVVLEVHDSGPGVPPERRAGLFDALTTTKAEGNGMGLFSVKACAQACSAAVEVGESPLGGACFRVRFSRTA